MLLGGEAAYDGAHGREKLCDPEREQTARKTLGFPQCLSKAHHKYPRTSHKAFLLEGYTSLITALPGASKPIDMVSLWRTYKIQLMVFLFVN